MVPAHISSAPSVWRKVETSIPMLHTILTLSSLVALLLHGSFCYADVTKVMVIATGTPGGTFFPVGYAIAELVTQMTRDGSEDSRIAMRAESTSGSWDNVKMLCEGKADFAILQGFVGAQVASAQNASIREETAECGKGELRSVSVLWKNVEHFLIRKRFASKGSILDLRNLDDEKFYLGKKGSGTLDSGRHILQSIGIELGNNPDLQYSGYSESAKELGKENGKIDGMNIPGGVPVIAAQEVFSRLGSGVQLLHITDHERSKVNKAPFEDLWGQFFIPANTYRPGQSEKIETIAQPNFLAVRADVNEKVVHQVTKIIFDNLPFLHKMHPATEMISLDEATDGLVFDLHEGACRFFEGLKDGRRISGCAETQGRAQ